MVKGERGAIVQSFQHVSSSVKEAGPRAIQYSVSGPALPIKEQDLS